MENQGSGANPNRKKRKRSDAIIINSVGEVVFFDYQKNKFGYIENIQNGTAHQPEKLRISLSDISTDKKLNDGAEVFFKLIKIGNAYRAKEVVHLIDALNVEFLASNNSLLDDHMFLEALLRLHFEDALVMNSIQEKSILTRLIKIRNFKAWEIICKYFNVECLKHFIAAVISILEDNEKLPFLRTSFNPNLANHIVQNWKSNRIEVIVDLFRILSKNGSYELYITQSLIESAKEITTNLEDAWSLYMIDNLRFKSLVLNHFHFKSDISLERFKVIRKEITDEEFDTTAFRLKLESDISEISCQNLIEFLNCTEIKDLLPDIEKLIKLLLIENGTHLDFYRLASCQYVLVNPELTSRVLNHWIKNYQTFEILYLFEKTSVKLPSSEILLFHLIEPMSNDNRIADAIILRLDVNGHDEIGTTFLNLITKNKILKKQSGIYKIALRIGDHSLTKKVFTLLEFTDTTQLFEFIETHGRTIISSIMREENKNLYDYIQLYFDVDIFTAECRSFLAGKPGKFQLFTAKLLIRNYNVSKDFNRLVSNINSFEWTTLSALILLKIIKHSELNETLVLNIVGETINEHFNKLSQMNFEKVAFDNDFQLSGVLPLCDGRKKYNIEAISENGAFRGWMSKSPSIIKSTRETLNCYCEGQPWKEESIINVSTGRPSDLKYKFYWCKGSYCAARNDISEIDKRPFHAWTLNEISIILNIKIEKTIMAKLAGWVNKYEAIFARLVCRECKSILRPVLQYSKYLGISSVPLFNCLNDQCGQCAKAIRFTHCLNGKCESHQISAPLDSRDCQPCHFEDMYNWGLECNYCGCSCPKCSKSSYRPTIAKDRW